jgi:xanthine dehydrogenase YagS FAD-binding subunit
LQVRRALRIDTGPLCDLRDLPGLDAIESVAEGTRVGARVPIATIASHAMLAAPYPAFALAAGGLATPQIRAVATLGGNLLQHVRCWYYLHPEFRCLKRGGRECFARTGDHLYSSCFDLGPCVAPHPSTMGLALLAYDAQVEIHRRASMSAPAFFGDGSDPRHENRMPDGHVLTSVLLPPPLFGERAAYVRAIARSRAEWPLVEVLARVVVESGAIRYARVAMGGVANIPMRLASVEAALEGSPSNAATLERAASIASDGANPLPMTKYKVELVRGTVLDALERALAAKPSEGAR